MTEATEAREAPSPSAGSEADGGSDESADAIAAQWRHRIASLQSPQVGHSEKQRLRGVIAAEEAGSRSWAALRPLTTPPEPRHPGQQAKPEQLESYAREAREFLERLAWVEGQNAGRLQLALSLRATLLELGEDEYAEVYSQKIREMYGLRNLPTDRGIIRRVASAATQWVSLRRKHGAVG